MPTLAANASARKPLSFDLGRSFPTLSSPITVVVLVKKALT